jgi:protein-disulfide isomerase-like protein with CxxC motif
MMPIVNGLEEEFAGKITVAQLNAAKSENVQLMQTYGLRGHPSFAVLDENGRVQQIFFGPQDAAVLRKALTAVKDN